MRFQPGDYVLVLCSIERVVSVSKTKAYLTDGNSYGIKWLAQWQRGFWYSEKPSIDYPTRSWSHRGI